MNPQNTVITPPTGGPVRISPIGFHRYALEFAKYAREAQAALGADEFSPVPYYLYCHSLELVLKAFLLAKGVPKADLPNPRKFGHDLSKILREAQGRDLEQTVALRTGWQSDINKVNTYYAKKGFEYFELTPKQMLKIFFTAVPAHPSLPALDVLNEIVTTFLTGLEQVCVES